MHIRVKVRPKSQKNEVGETLEDGTLKLQVKAPPEKGKANDAVVELLSSHYNVPKSAVKIISGHTSQIKLVRIDES